MTANYPRINNEDRLIAVWPGLDLVVFETILFLDFDPDGGTGPDVWSAQPYRNEDGTWEFLPSDLSNMKEAGHPDDLIAEVLAFCETYHKLTS